MSSPFPSQIAEKPAYFADVLPFLDTYKVLYKVDLVKLGEAQAFYEPVATPGTYLYCLAEYGQVGKRKDSVVVARLKAVTNKLEKKLMEIYNDIPDSLWDEALRGVTNRKTGLPHTITHHSTPIPEECVLNIAAERSGLFSGGARTSTDSKKHDIPPLADMLEIRFVVVAGKFEIPADLSGKIRQSCTGPLDGTFKEVYSKALFELHIDPELSGFELHVWGRWIDSKHPELAGNWSERHILLILP